MAMREKITVAIDFVTDGAQRGLSGIKARVAEADGAFGKLKAGASGAFDLIRQNGALSATVAGAAFVKFAQKSIAAASDLEESTNAVSVTFGDAARGILALGESAAESVGLSNAEFNSLAVQFSAFAQTVAGDGGDVVGVMDDITKRAADFASVMNLEVADAARIFQSGLAGESEPLRKFGIDMSAASVNAYALANGIGASGRQLTEAEKVMARYGLLMEATEKTAGDFANTSDSLANSQRILNAQLTDVQATVGTRLIPVVAQATANLNKMLEVAEDLKILDFAGEVVEITTAFGALTRAQDVLSQETDLLGRRIVTLSQAHFDAILAAKEAGATDEELIELKKRLIDNTNRQTEAQEQIAAAIAAAEVNAQAYMATQRELTGAQEAQTAAIEDAITAQERQSRAAAVARDRQRALADAHYAAQVAGEDLIKTINESTTVLAENAEGSIENQAALRDVALAAVDYAAAQVEMKGASLDTERGQQLMNDALLDVANTLSGPMRQEVLNHIARLNGIPEERATSIEALIDAMSATEAERDLEHLARDRRVRLFATTSGVVGSLGSNIARYAGGPIPGARNQPVPILAHGGEYVMSADQVDAIKRGGTSRGLPTASPATSAAPNYEVHVHNNGRDLTPFDISRAIQMTELMR